MICREIVFSGHALQRMFERSIGRAEVIDVVANGATIEDYSEDVPYPSSLLFAQLADRPLHVVVGFDEDTGRCIVVTAYIPSLDFWEADYRTRKP